jgi:signal transduction histidine kinase
MPIDRAAAGRAEAGGEPDAATADTVASAAGRGDGRTGRPAPRTRAVSGGGTAPGAGARPGRDAALHAYGTPAPSSGGASALTEEALRRTFEEAQRQADTVFAQYQLSQLLALGADLPAMTTSVIAELVRASDAVAGAIWLSDPGESGLHLVATEPDLLLGPSGPTGWTIGGLVREPGKEGDWPGHVIPGGFVTRGVARSWITRHGWHGVSLDERLDVGGEHVGAQTVGYLALRPPEGKRLPADRIRLLALVRHELAIAFRAAQLREELASEQAMLAAILDGASEGIVAVDERRRVVRVNRAAVALLDGRTSDPGTSCEEVLGCRRDGRLRCGDRCRFEEVLRGPAGFVETELTLDGATEGGIPVAASFSVMAGPEPGAVVVLRDLRAERAAEELRASFLAAVSHELRTPLALISGHVDSLLDLDMDPDEERRSVERIGTAAARLQALVDELLDLTQLEHQSLGLHRSRIALAELLDSVTGGLGEWPGMPPVTVTVPVGLPDVSVDAVRMGHVLVNLVDNARRYGGGAPIHIRARRQRSTVVVTVEDEGRGIPMEERPFVFDRQYRGRVARERHPGGTGLGLHVCRRLVEAHGGRIWIEPGAARSAISFSLPAARRQVRDGDRARDTDPGRDAEAGPDPTLGPDGEPIAGGRPTSGGEAA